MRSGIVYQTRIVYDGEIEYFEKNRNKLALPYGKGRILLPNGMSFEGSFGVGNNHLLLSNDGLFYIGEVIKISQEYPMYFPHGNGITRDINGDIIHSGKYYFGIRKEKIIWICSNNVPIRHNGNLSHFTPRFNNHQNFFVLPALCIEDKPWYAENLIGRYFGNTPSWLQNSNGAKFSNNVRIAIPALEAVSISEDELFLSIVHPDPEDAVKFNGFKDIHHYYQSVITPEKEIYEKYIKVLGHIAIGISVVTMACSFGASAAVHGVIPAIGHLTEHAIKDVGIHVIGENLAESGLEKYIDHLKHKRMDSSEQKYIEFIEYLRAF